MKFAREEVRDSVRGISKGRRQFSALYIALGAYFIVTSPRAAAGLRRRRPRRRPRDEGDEEQFSLPVDDPQQLCISWNSSTRSACSTKPAMYWYRKANNALMFVITQSCCSDAACLRVPGELYSSDPGGTRVSAPRTFCTSIRRRASTGGACADALPGERHLPG